MRRIRKILARVLTFVVVFCGLGIHAPNVQASTNYVTVKKTVNPTTMTTLDEAEVTLSIKASPPVSVVMPNDVILIIDKSGSMLPNNNPNREDKITDAKNAAKSFIDLMDMTKHRVGIVDYSSPAMVNSFDLTTDAAAAKAYIGGISANGSTDTGKAVEVAAQMLADHREEAQPVIVIMTDGAANVGPNGESSLTAGFNYAKAAAAAAKDQEIVFYTIALLNVGEDPEVSDPNLLLKEMATTAQHHHFVLGSTGLEEIYTRIVQEIGRAAAYDVTVTDIVAPEFEIVTGSTDNNIPKPLVTGNILTWTFQELKDQELVFKYKIKHKEGERIGNLPISTSTKVTYKSYSGAALTANAATPYLNVKYPAPVIDSITPDNGPVNGGILSVLNGNYFRPGVTVTFGNTPASSVEYINSQQLKVTAPSGVQGEVTVTVKNTDNQSAATKFRYWADPVINSITPSSGLVTGGLKVAIEGDYFMRGVSVKFGDKAATAITYSSSKKIIATTPMTTSAGPVDVVLENPDGTKVTAEEGFTYLLPAAPQISSVVPNTGLVTGGEVVKINGANFNSNSKVYFGDIQLSVDSVSGTQLMVKSPVVQEEGPVDVIVTDAYGQSAVVPQGFTYTKPVPPAPVISSVTPNSGYTTGGEYVYINGSNYYQDSKVFFGSIEVPINYYMGVNKIRIIAPAVDQPETIDITIVNSDGLSGKLEQAYTYVLPPLPPAPELISVNPDSGLTTGGETVKINGKNFAASTKAFLGSAEATVKSWTSTQLTIIAPAGQVGVVDVKVVDSYDQTYTLPQAYTYNEPPKLVPTITSLTPNSGYTTGGDYVYMEGTNYSPDTKVYFGSIEVPIDYFMGASKLRVKSPAVGTAGPVDVTVSSVDGLSNTLPGGFTYIELPPEPGPEITALSPNNGYTSGGDYVYIEGKNFKTASKVYFGSIEVPIDYFMGASKVRVKSPAVSQPGPVDVTVVNPDGQSAVLPAGFTYNIVKPKIKSLSPNNGLITGQNQVYIEGENLAADTKIFFGAAEAFMDYYVGSTKVRVLAPASATAGSVDVTAVNSNGESFTLAGGYTYNSLPQEPAPTITSLSPANGPMAGGTLVYINGTNFKTTSKVFVGTIEIPIDYYSGTSKIRIKTPAVTTSGPVDITVINPDGKTAVKAGGFIYDAPPELPAPVITSLSPNSAAATGGVYVYINGSGFTSQSRIFFGDIEVPIDYFLGSTKIRVKSPAVDASMVNTSVDVKVINPDGKSVTLTAGFTYK